MAWTIYRNTDASAPILTGQSGSLITLFDAVLVNGYGSQPAAGWSKPYTFSSSFGAVYYPSASAASKMYYRINDSGNLTASLPQRFATIQGFENMISAASGSLRVPDLSPNTNEVKIVKSNTSDAVVRPWIIAADEKTCMLFTGVFDTTASVSQAVWVSHYFGEIYPYKENDAYHSVIVGVGTSLNSTYTNTEIYLTQHTYTFLSSSYTGNGIWIMRSYDEFPLYDQCGLISPSALRDSYIGELPRLNPAEGGLYTTDIWVVGNYPNYNIRGKIRGLKAHLHSENGWPTNYALSYNGTGTQLGRRFEMIDLLCRTTSPTAYYYVLETSNTVE